MQLSVSFSRAGPSRWRGCNHRFHDNLQQDLADRRTVNPPDPVLSQNPFPRKANCSSARTTEGFISHPDKVMLKIILNRLKPQAEKTIAEEQAGFRAGRSTTD